MCGMVGEYSASPDESWVKLELERHRFRGPDHTEVIRVNSNLILGANRLAMVDRHPRSNQPMINRDSNSVLTFNGEIYNFKILKRQIESEGVQFNTESDTEVLLMGLEVFGIEFIKDLNGMYSFVYFDATKNKLFFSRDRLGKKPLYLKYSKSGLKWSSNFSSFLEKRNQMNRGGLESYLRFGYSIDPTTFIENVTSLEPGTVLEVSLNSMQVPKSVPHPKRSKSSSSFRSILTSAVEARSNKEEVIGISLSGGLDSTLIAIICKDLGLNVRSYSAHWSNSDKPRYNEDARAAFEISKILKIEHTNVEMLSPEELPLKLQNYVRAMEEPNNNATGVSMMDLYSKISEDGIRLTLTGDGADELFAGYDRYRLAKRFPKVFNLDSKLWIETPSNDFGKYMSRMISSQFSATNFSFWSSWQSIFSGKEIKKILGQLTNSNANLLFSGVLPISAQFSTELIQKQDLQVWIGMESNRRLDRVSMFHSIEARSPFLDNRILDYAIPFLEKSELISKLKLFRVEFPELFKLPVLTKKAGFISPIGHWLRGNPEYVSEQIKFLSDFCGFRKPFLQELLRSPSSGNFENLKKLWSLLVLSVWMQIYNVSL